VKTAATAQKPLITGDIVFENATFAYEHTGIVAVKEFNLTINSGERVALVGRTGSGKTTVAQLLMRMFDVTTGSIRLNGADLKEIDLGYLRKNISYVPQDGFLFSDTIENNISFGSQSRSLERVKESAQLAVVNKDIESFPAQYQTEIGERGVMLSGGQKQRISIARALMKDAPIIILDDCLSAVDAKTEKEIISNLEGYLQNKTSIFITHRIFSLFHFDKIIVLEQGKILEIGNHDDLLARKGVYYEMYLKQLKEDVDTNSTANLAVEKT
jgi:ATP-binding cassette subfamily B multidrug efflux pump